MEKWVAKILRLQLIPMISLSEPQNRSSEFKNRLLHRAKKLNSVSGSLYSYWLFLSLFWGFYIFKSDPIINLISAIPGTVALMVIPGAILSKILLPNRKTTLFLSLSVGLLFNCLIIHLLFLIRLILLLSLPLLHWLSIWNSLLIIVGAIMNKYNGADNERELVSAPKNKWLLLVISIALVIRVFLATMSTNSIALDASLYADYARSILDGEFSSHVLKSGTIYQISDAVQYSYHQGFIYLSAISFLLFSPARSGPSFMLIILGLCVLLLAYDLCNKLFGETAGLFSAFVISMHPLMVFHSVIAYGPELASLFFVLSAIYILITKGQTYTEMIVAGAFFGFADIIWTPNFLLFCSSLPFIVFMISPADKLKKAIISIGIYAMALVRIFFTQLQIPALFILIGLIFLAYVSAAKQKDTIMSALLFLGGILGVILFWRFIIQISFNTATAGAFMTKSSFRHILQIPSLPIDLFFRNLSPTVVLDMLYFFLHHTTPIILVLALSTMFIRDRRRAVLSFLIACLIGMVGTVFIFNAFSSSKTVLTMYYLYSDSRFFLSLVLLLILSSSNIVNIERNSKIEPAKTLRLSNFVPINRRVELGTVFVSLLVISMVPGYISIPTGIVLVDYESRYGWVNLKEGVDALTDDEAVFLVNRYTEFAWLTGKKTVTPGVSKGAYFRQALTELMYRKFEYNASYFLLDGYSVANYGTLAAFLNMDLQKGGSIPINLMSIDFTQNTFQELALTLEYQTPRNSNGDYSRLFRFEYMSFEKIQNINLLSDGWAAGNNGIIANLSGMTRLVIGEERNYTFCTRTDLLEVYTFPASGFILASVQEESAKIARIEFYGENGDFIGHGSRIATGEYFFFIGHSTVGDMRIVIEGEPDSYVVISEVALWAQKT